MDLCLLRDEAQLEYARNANWLLRVFERGPAKTIGMIKLNKLDLQKLWRPGKKTVVPANYNF